MKVGVIGAGQWGKNIVRTLHEMGALAGVADMSPELRQGIREKYPAVPVFETQEALLATDLTAVAIATPVSTHHAVAKAAMLAGKDVFVEKPLAMTVADAQDLVAIAKVQGRVLMVGHLLLYQPAVKFIKQYLASGALGRVYSLHQERLNLGRARAVENALWSLGVHDVAVLLHLSDELPETVIATGQRALQPRIEDDVHLHMGFASGLQAHLHVSWLWPELRRRLVVVGERGMLVYNEQDHRVLLFKKGITATLANRDEGSEVLFEGHSEPLQLEMAHFIECATQRLEPISSGSSAVNVVRVLEQASKQLECQ